jgi:hypothetical protein
MPPGAKVLDVGCDDGQLFRSLGPSLRGGLGIDANLVGELTGDRYRWCRVISPRTSLRMRATSMS